MAIVAWDMPRTATFGAGLVPVIEIAFDNGMWWPIPQDMSQELYDRYLANETDIGYTWNWGSKRYIIDFEAGIQRNIDNNRLRSMRVVWVDPASTTAHWTGQIPGKPGKRRRS